MNSYTESLVREFYEEFSSCSDLQAFLKKYTTEDIVWENYLAPNVPFGGKFSGQKAYADYLIHLNQTIDMQVFEVERIICSDGHVAIFGSETSEVYGTGKKYKMDWVHTLTLVDGKVKWGREYNDTAAMQVAFPECTR